MYLEAKLHLPPYSEELEEDVPAVVEELYPRGGQQHPVAEEPTTNTLRNRLAEKVGQDSTH